jgi:hypothetical protein
MRIVNREEFFSLGDNIVFCYVDEHQNLSGPCIKDSNCGDIDFFVSDLNEVTAYTSNDQFDKIEEMQKDSSISVPMDFESSGRDGMFVDDQMFAVYEAEDVLKLITRLINCLPEKVTDAIETLGRVAK